MVSQSLLGQFLVFGHTLIDSTLGAHLLDLEATALSHGKVIAASLQGVGAVAERALVGAQVCCSLSDLPGILFSTVTRVGDGLLSKESSSCESGDELHTGGRLEGGRWKVEGGKWKVNVL
jgi:hypothetical protein